MLPIFDIQISKPKFLAPTLHAAFTNSLQNIEFPRDCILYILQGSSEKIGKQ